MARRNHQDKAAVYDRDPPDPPKSLSLLLLKPQSRGWQGAITRTKQPNMAWIRPTHQILTRTHFGVDNRIPIRTQFRQQNRIRLRRLNVARVTGVGRNPRSRDLDHGRGDAQRAVPRTLRTAIGDALGAACFGGGGDAAGDAGGDDAAEVEAKVKAYFDGNAD